jgi:thiol-disulfide isomerase/thioredoxin
MSKYCGVYIDYLIDKYKVDSCLDKNRRFQVTECIKFFSKTYSGTLKEQLIACIIAETKQYPQELRKIIDYELLSMKNPDYRRFLKNVEDTRIDGATAYNFRLKDTQGRKVQLNDFKGKVVILDFWFTGCINCEELAPYMKNIEMQFSDMPVVFVSISIDKIKEQWLKSIISGTYSSPEIVNLCTNDDNIRKEVLQNYHIDSYPTLVIINKKGNVVNVHIDPRNDNGISLQKQISDCLN